MGGGKSYVCLAVAILLSKIFPGSIWCVIRESLPTLKKTSLPTFWKVCPKNFIRSYNQQDQVVNFTNGSKIMFMAEDYANDKDFDRFKGLEVNGFVLEQIEELNSGLLDVCFIRAGRHKLKGKQPKPMVIANVNPTLAWPKDKVYDRYVAGTLPHDWFYMPATIADNPALFADDEYMSRLDNLDSLTRKRLIEGDWTAFAVKAPFLYAFQVGKHEIKEYVPNPHLPLYVSFDFNKEPMTSVIGQKPDITKLRVFDEITIAGGSTPEVCDVIIARYKDWLGRIMVTGDATGRNRTSMVRGNINHYDIIMERLALRKGDLLVPRQNSSHVNSRILCNSVLQNADFRITSNCKNTVKDCVFAEVDEDGELMKSAIHGLHWLDNLRYMLEAAFPDFIKKGHLYRQ